MTFQDIVKVFSYAHLEIFSPLFYKRNTLFQKFFPCSISVTIRVSKIVLYFIFESLVPNKVPGTQWMFKKCLETSRWCHG